MVAQDSSVSLDGQWRFQLDRENAGVEEAWFQRRLPEKVYLPGCLAQQGVGDAVTLSTPWMGEIKHRQWHQDPLYAKYADARDFRFPFWLQPDKYYAGAAWYQRDVEIPPSWQGRRVTLTLERPHWATQVWVDDREIGSNDSLSTPHVYDLGSALTPGKHQLTVRVDNSLVVDIGVNSHSISDHTQGNWNGIVGRLELHATGTCWIDDLQVFPNASRKEVSIRARLENASEHSAKRSLTVEIVGADQANATGATTIAKAVSIPPDGMDVEITVPLGETVQLWDEFSPALYRLRATLSDAKNRHHEHSREASFGVRDISTSGTQFTINGRKTFFRGTLECAVFPATGYPPTDVDSWKRIIRICKAHGLNMLRFHSWCPPEAAFEAADELGFYVQIEAGSWANFSTTLGDSKPVDDWVIRETDRILRAYGNHPSFVLMAYGNEPAGNRYEAFLADWVKHCRQQDPRRLYSSAAGWPQIAENQFQITPEPRLQQWGVGLKSRLNGQPPETVADYRDYIAARKVPVISHEIGQWCAYPNFDEIGKYTGYLKPKNLTIFRDSLHAHGMGDQAHDFLMASGKLQTLCYKEEIEAALRTPGMGGFQLLGLSDFPGQGTALVGALDSFWDSKGYVSPEEYRRFCNSTVPLARLERRVFTSDETLTAALEVAHFGPTPLKDAIVRWQLINEDGRAAAEGTLPTQTIPVDNGVPLGQVEISLKGFPTPAKYELAVNIVGTPFENDWNVWIYPPTSAANAPSDVLVVDELNDDALSKLAAGGKVLLMAPPARVKGDRLGKVGLGFSSIFWNTAWTGRQPPHTLGILCDPDHPLFADFPTEFHSNWQWWYLIRRGGAMILDDLPAKVRPLVQVIDDWTTNRRLGLVFEAKVNDGNLLVCGIDLEHGLDSDPVRRQFRQSLLNYMSGKHFAPQHVVTVDQVRDLMSTASPMNRLGAIAVSASSEELGEEGCLAIDGDPRTRWHTQWRHSGPTFPHSLQVEFESPIAVDGFTVLPRQDDRRNGWVNDYSFYVSDDGETWGEPVTRGSFAANNELKIVTLPSPAAGRFFKLVAVSGFDSLPYASIAEFSIVPSRDCQKVDKLP